MTWQSVGTHTFVPTDKAVQVGSFDLAAGQDTIWVKITQLNPVDDWPWSYGILSWQNANGTPLGSIKAYSNRLGEVFRLGNGLPPSDGTGSIWFEPRGFNLGWLKAGFPWELQFEAQAGASDLTSGYWNRDPNSGVITPKTSGDNLDMGEGWIKAKNLTISSGAGSTDTREVAGFQQGVWTPAVTSGTVSPSNAVFFRVGPQVTVSSRLNSLSDTTTSSVLEVTAASLPYPPSPPSQLVCVGSAIGAYIATEISAAEMVSSGALRFGGSSVAEAENFRSLLYKDFAANGYFMFTATYITADSTWVPNT